MMIEKLSSQDLMDLSTAVKEIEIVEDVLNEINNAYFSNLEGIISVISNSYSVKIDDFNLNIDKDESKEMMECLLSLKQKNLHLLNKKLAIRYKDK